MTSPRKFFPAAALIGIISFSSMVLAAAPITGSGGMMANVNAASPAEKAQTARDETAGKAIWDELRAKTVDCASLSADAFDVLGDYFMGLMAGDSHASMNANMTSMMGEQGEKQMHIVLGKRMSGCQADAAFPAPTHGNGGYYRIMGMMGALAGRDAWTDARTVDAWPMRAFVAVNVLLVWTLFILAIVALVRWIIKRK